MWGENYVPHHKNQNDSFEIRTMATIISVVMAGQLGRVSFMFLFVPGLTNLST